MTKNWIGLTALTLVTKVICVLGLNSTWAIRFHLGLATPQDSFQEFQVSKFSLLMQTGIWTEKRRISIAKFRIPQNSCMYTATGLETRSLWWCLSGKHRVHSSSLKSNFWKMQTFQKCTEHFFDNSLLMNRHKRVTSSELTLACFDGTKSITSLPWTESLPSSIQNFCRLPAVESTSSPVHLQNLS